MDFKKRLVLIAVFAPVLGFINAPLLQYNLVENPYVVWFFGSLLFLFLHFLIYKNAVEGISPYSGLKNLIIDLLVMLVVSFFLMFFLQVFLYLFDISDHSFSRLIKIIADIFSGRNPYI